METKRTSVCASASSLSPTFYLCLSPLSSSCSFHRLSAVVCVFGARGRRPKATHSMKAVFPSLAAQGKPRLCLTNTHRAAHSQVYTHTNTGSFTYAWSGVSFWCSEMWAVQMCVAAQNRLLLFHSVGAGKASALHNPVEFILPNYLVVNPLTLRHSDITNWTQTECWRGVSGV